MTYSHNIEAEGLSSWDWASRPSGARLGPAIRRSRAIRASAHAETPALRVRLDELLTSASSPGRPAIVLSKNIRLTDSSCSHRDTKPNLSAYRVSCDRQDYEGGGERGERNRTFVTKRLVGPSPHPIGSAALQRRVPRLPKKEPGFSPAAFLPRMTAFTRRVKLDS